MIPWVEIIRLVAELMEQCSEDQRQKQLQEPGLLARLTLRRAVRKAGTPWQYRHEAVEVLLEELGCCDDERRRRIAQDPRELLTEVD